MIATRVAEVTTPVCLLYEIPRGHSKTVLIERSKEKVLKHTSNNPRSTGKSLLRTCIVCSLSVKNGSQQRMKEATTVQDSLINKTNLEQKQRYPVRQGEIKNSEKSVSVSLKIINLNV